MNQLAKTILFTRLDEAIDLYTSLPAESAIEKIQQNPIQWTYLYRVNDYSIRLLDTAYLLTKIAKQAKNILGQSYLQVIGFDEVEYFDYCVQNFYIRLVTTYDIMLLLCSNLYNLGLDDKDVKENHITKNLLYKNLDPSENLKKYRDLIRPIRNKRNLIVHRGFLSNEDINEFLHQKNKSNIKKDHSLFDSQGFERFKNEELKKIKQLLFNSNKILTEFGNSCGAHFWPYFNSIKYFKDDTSNDIINLTSRD
ncbi:Cthe_2314 family HEPN domain-containing protein [uncultured Roseivirga sp.]|uniref:Cthe_2314 family HEPN domain-containing protein n=1 Tax=uncultured Roseivirga sp. TaxID=543088 RepID=UPI000D79E69A|nr:Cthe_2314 family HEPN domain-containing protein [uncultured Roseivirga sp.]PWL29130.1 MAG: hypothetical protein DCO95_11865 [Roseivirga sp. XM-24bin3]